MKISDLGEFGLIRRIRKMSAPASDPVLVGIGDDAAAVKVSANHILLVTTDLLLEDIHFKLSYTDNFSLGWKAAAVNLSDIAAMGGRPLFCLTALGIPRPYSAKAIHDFYLGFNELLSRHGLFLVGGDTCSSRDRLVVSVTALGESKPENVIKRSGARPGDRIFVTGTLGDSAAGMELLQMGNAECGVRNKRAKLRTSGKAAAWLVERHLRPVPRLLEGRFIAESGCASAMIDISDGLSSDLHHICAESRVGARVLSDKIPFSTQLQTVAPLLRKKPAEYALSGGEDYELLFTVHPDRVRKLRSLNLSITEIGTIVRGSSVSLVESTGRKTRLQPKGFDHFAAGSSGK